MKSILVLATATFKSLLRDRILYNVIFVGLFLLLVGYWASLLVYGNQHRVMLHFGVLVNSLTVFGIAMAAGSKVVVQETESRLIYLILSKPLSRAHYWLGKSLGIGAFLALNTGLLTLVLIGGVQLAGGPFHSIYFQSASLIWLEAWILCHFAMWLSLKLSSAVSIMLTLTFVFISHNQDQVRFLQEQKAAGATALQFLSQLFPRGDLFLLDTRIYYELPLTLAEWSLRLGLGAVWWLVFFVLGSVFFYRKNL